MTKIQTKYFEYIKDYISNNKVSPTLKEIANHFNVTLSTAQSQVNNLIILGKIGKIPNVKNGIFLVKDKASFWKAEYKKLLKKVTNL